MPRAKDTFLGYVQLNERAWGTEGYPNRPTLEEILEARVVAFWSSTRRKEPGYRVTVHQNLSEIHRFASEMLIHSRTQVPDKRLTKLYVDKRQVRIKAVRVLLEYDE